MEIISNKEEIKASQNEVFGFLTDLNNLKQLMPDQVTEWTSDSEQCSYVLNGMANISMKIVQRTPDSEIKIESFGKVPFTFTLAFELSKISDAVSAAQLHFKGDVNMFMKPMIEKPLTNFFNFIVGRLKKKYEPAA